MSTKRGLCVNTFYYGKFIKKTPKYLDFYLPGELLEVIPFKTQFYILFFTVEFLNLNTFLSIFQGFFLYPT